MKPACEIDEYASIRFTFRCVRAPRLPIASEATAITAIAIVHSCFSAGNAVVISRSVSTSAVVFVAAAMKPVTGVGAPS